MILSMPYRPGLNIYATVAMLKDRLEHFCKPWMWSYLLIEQGPEHWQRDVENQNAQHHLDLLDQAFLIGVNRDKVEGDGEGEGEFRPEGLQLGCEFLHGRVQLPSTCPRPSPASGFSEARPLTSASVV